MAASQAPAPLIPQSPVHVVNKDSNLFIKNGPPSQQASGLLLAPGREGGGEAERRGPRVRATPAGASLGQSPTCCGHSLPNSPSDSEDAWGQSGGRTSDSSCQLLSHSVTGLCGCPINVDNTIWHQVPVQTTAPQEAFTVLKTNRTPSPRACRSRLCSPALDTLCPSLEQLRPTDPGLLTPVPRTDWVQQGTGARVWGPTPAHGNLPEREAVGPSDPVPLLMS